MKLVGRPPLLILVCVLLLLGGCAAKNDSAPTGPPSTTMAPTSWFGTPVTVGSGERAGSEPTVLLDNDGRAFLSAPTGLGGHSLLWISEDSGSTWKNADPNTQYPGGGDSSLAIGKDGSVYMTDLWVGSNTVSSTHDHGKTWFSTPLSSTSGYYDREWNAVDTKGNAYVLARQFDPGATTYVSKSTDGGMTWATVGVAWADPRPGGTSFGTIDPNQNGPLLWNAKKQELALVYTCNADYSTICFTTSKDEGMTWQPTDTPLMNTRVVVHRNQSVFHLFPALAVDTAGNYYIAWSDATAGSLDLYYVHSTDGKAWSQPVRINAAKGSHLFPWIAAGDEGRLAVAWYGSSKTGDNNNPDTMKNAEWTLQYAQSLDALSSAPHFTQMEASDGVVHKGSVSTKGFDPTDTSNPPDRILGDFLTVAIDPQGYSHIAYCKGSRGGDPLTTMYVKQTSGPSLFASPPQPIWR